MSETTSSLKSGFRTMFGEVCVRDFYRLYSVPFTPTVILDLGANVGVFTTFARCLFPEARIIALEPNPVNYDYLTKHTAHLPDVTYVQKALGVGPLWSGASTSIAPYWGSLQSYVSEGQTGFPRGEMSQLPDQPGRDGLVPYVPAPEIQFTTLDALIEDYVDGEDLLLVKMDCEGGENYMFSHQPSMIAMRRADYLTMETHFYVKGTGTQHEENKRRIIAGLSQLRDTHDCKHEEEERRFTAVKKGLSCQSK